MPSGACAAGFGDGVIGGMTADAVHRRLDALWRMESPRLLARIARITGNIDTAEELAQDVLVGALERWPREGLPGNPAAWLMTAAKHRAIDHVRQRQLHARKQDEYGIELEEWSALPRADPGDVLLTAAEIAPARCRPTRSRCLGLFAAEHSERAL